MDRTGVPIFEPEVKGKFSLTPNFKVQTPESQLSLLNLCEKLYENSLLSDDNENKLIGSMQCWIMDFENNVNIFPIQNEEYFKNNLTYFLSDYYDNGSFKDKFYSDIMLKLDTLYPLMITIPLTTTTLKNADLSKRYNDRDKLLKFIKEWYDSDINKNSNLGEYHIHDYNSIWIDTQQQLVNSSISGLLIGVSIAYIVLLFATNNFMLATVTMISISGVISCVIGTMVLLGWALGFMESISIVCLVGLAIDFSLHLSIAYQETHHPSGQESRYSRMVNAATRLGVSVIGGGITTTGASIFLLLTTITYLAQFGAFLLMVIVYSVFFANTLLLSLLATVGPEHNTWFGLKNFGNIYKS